MSRLKCPECNERTCRFEASSINCGCGASFSPTDIEEYALDASEEGVPMECPFCGRPNLEVIVTGEKCSSCDYAHDFPSTPLDDLFTDKYDDPGDEEKDVEPKNYPEILFGDQVVIVYDEKGDFNA